MADECPVCAKRSLGMVKIKDMHLGKLSPYQVAEQLGCTYEQVMTHVNESHEIKIDPDGLMQSPDALLNRLMISMNTLDEWTGYIIQTVKEPKDVDRAKVQMMVQLTQEIRKTVESIAVLQGRVGNGDASLQIKVLNTRVIDLTNTVLDCCCSECKMRVLERMDRTPTQIQEASYKCLPSES